MPGCVEPGSRDPLSTLLWIGNDVVNMRWQKDWRVLQLLDVDRAQSDVMPIPRARRPLGLGYLRCFSSSAT